MMNNNLINQATKLVMEYMEAHYITISEAVIRRQVESWYINTDAATPYIIAASVIEYGSYQDTITYTQMQQAEQCHYSEISMWRWG